MSGIQGLVSSYQLLLNQLHELELHACTNFSPTTSKKSKCFIKNSIEINMLHDIVITYTNSLCNKTIILIKGNESREQPRQSHSTHTCDSCDILNGTGHSLASAEGRSQPEHISVSQEGRCSELKGYNILHLCVTI